METSQVPAAEEQHRQAPDATVPSAHAISEFNTQSVAMNNSKEAPVDTATEQPPAGGPTAPAPAPATEAVADAPKPNGIDAHVASPPQPAPVEDSHPTSVTAISSLVNETNTTPKAESTQAPDITPTDPADPAVQQPTSDLRSMTEPATEARATEIKEAKQHSDLASDQELATGLAASTNAPIERTITPTPEESTERSAPVTEPQESKEVSGAELPHRAPSDAAISDGVVEPTPTPAVTEQPTSEVQPATDVLAPKQPAIDDDYVMVDAPSPAKVPRPREEEDAQEPEEPATKRMKQDTAEDPAPADEQMADAPTDSVAPKTASAAVEPEKAPSPAPAQPTPKDESATGTEAAQTKTEAAPAEGTAQAEAAGKTQLTPYVRKSGNTEFDKPITVPQKKSLQRIVTNVKRGQHAGAFKQPVDPVALNIPTYFDVIKHPMDLSTMEKKVKDNEYTTVNEFIKDFDQMVINCETFNGLAHDITKHGHELGKSFEKQIAQIPTSEFVEPPPPEKKTGARTPTEPRSRRRESRASIGGGAGSPAAASGAATAKSPTAASPSSPAFALKEGGIPQIRRGSEAGPDGRPRREIHPPAPKELPYSTQKPRKKKYQAELKFCQKVLNDLKAPNYNASNWPFLQPVDPVAMNLPTYRKVVKKPMDLSTIQNKLTKNEYEDAKEFEADVRLIFANCFKFNVEGDPVHRAGKSLENVFNDLWEKKKEWLKKNAPKSGGASPESGSEGSDAEEEEDDADDDDDEEEEKTEKMKQLEQQIQQMSRSLEQMRKGSDAGKKKKRTKSISKTKETKKKPKAEKKSSAPKSKPKVHYVTYEQKQDISERINTLPPAQMNQALKVIRDNMPNLKGAQEDEIELDIDELPNEVLHKLLMFVRKYAPRAEDPVEPKSAPKPAASTKPKKNKPMGKVEQEARIKELKEKLAGGGGAIHSDDSPTQAAADDSSDDDDDDSEESEED